MLHGFRGAPTLPKGTGYEPLDAHTAAAWEAERTGGWPGYEKALRDLMRTAKREALREGKTA